MFYLVFDGVSLVFHKGFMLMFQGIFKKVSRKFQECFKDVLFSNFVAWQSLQLSKKKGAFSSNFSFYWVVEHCPFKQMIYLLQVPFQMIPNTSLLS